MVGSTGSTGTFPSATNRVEPNIGGSQVCGWQSIYLDGHLVHGPTAKERG